MPETPLSDFIAALDPKSGGTLTRRPRCPKAPHWSPQLGTKPLTIFQVYKALYNLQEITFTRHRSQENVVKKHRSQTLRSQDRVSKNNMVTRKHVLKKQWCQENTFTRHNGVKKQRCQDGLFGTIWAKNHLKTDENWQIWAKNCVFIKRLRDFCQFSSVFSDF